MPSFYGAGIRMRLAVLPLAESITPDIVRKKGEKAARNAEMAEKKLLQSEYLDEERVRFPGDEEGFAVNWLGEAPFLQVLAGGDAFEKEDRPANLGRALSKRVEASKKNASKPPPEGRRPAGMSTRSTRGFPVAETGTNESSPDTSSEGRRSTGMATRSSRPSAIEANSREDTLKSLPEGRRSSRLTARAHPQTPSLTIDPALLQINSSSNASTANAELRPKALVLHVMLSDKTFYKSFADGAQQHLKIDVFFNGQLSGCVHIHPRDVRGGVKSMHQVFSGTRVDYLIERPWVIIPPNQNVGENLRSSRKAVSEQVRWSHIAEELMKEANARGMNKNGERPASAQYLKELANMRMPEGVKEMQKVGGRSFGVIDVIVTVGNGRKITTGTSYLKTPMRLVDQKYAFKVTQKVNKETEQSAEEQVDVGLSKGAEESAIDVAVQEEPLVDVDADGDSDPDYETTSYTLQDELGVRPSSDPSQHPAFHDPFTGAPIPPAQPFFQAALPSSYPNLDADSGLLPDRPNPFLSRKRGFSEFVTSVQEEQDHAEERMQQRQVRQSFPSAHAPTVKLGNSYPQANLGLEFNLNQYDGFMHPNPYQLPYAGMMASLDTASIPNFAAIDGPSSSPFRHNSLGQLVLPPSNPFDLDSMQGTEKSGALLVSSPFSAPNILPPQTQRESFRLPNNASFYSGMPPNETPTTLDMPEQGQFSLHGSTYGSSPFLHHNMGSYGSLPGYHFNSSAHLLHRPPPGPLPPIGSFAVTTKPKTPLPKDPGYIDPDQPRSSFLLRRLIVAGKKGVVIVDHQWEVPQRIAVKPSSTDSNRPPFAENSIKKPRQESPGSAEYTESSFALHRQDNEVPAIATPPPTSPHTHSAGMAMSMNSMKRDSVHDGLVAVKPLPSATTLLTDSAKDMSSTPTSLAVESVDSRRRIPSNSILGVQGPKASPFVFDDPEELLRKASKLRSNDNSRSVSPTKIDTVPIEGVGWMKEVEVEAVQRVAPSAGLETGSSSPLSSLLSSPQLLPVDGKDGAGDVVMSGLQPSAQPSPHIQSTPPTQTRATHAPATPAALPSRKKNDTHILQSRNDPRTRKPVSPDRLSTAGNPPLNRNCVIQYATSHEESSALRQVKSERQGVFAEDSVVVGMRFFVAG